MVCNHVVNLNTNLQFSIRNLQNICRNIWNLQNICKNGLRNQNQQQNISMAVKSMREQVDYLNKSVFFGPCFLPSTNVLWSQLKTEFTLVFGLPLLPFWKITQIVATMFFLEGLKDVADYRPSTVILKVIFDKWLLFYTCNFIFEEAAITA